MRHLPLPCQCESGVEATRANDVDGVTEYMCRECCEVYPVLKLGESWEPGDNELTAVYVARMQAYRARVNPAECDCWAGLRESLAELDERTRELRHERQPWDSSEDDDGLEPWQR